MIGPTNALTVTGTVDPGSVTVGSNLKPVKLVNGVATAVDNDLVDTASAQIINGEKTFGATGQITLTSAGGAERRIIYKDSAIDTTAAAPGAIIESGKYCWRDKNNVFLGDLGLSYGTDKSTAIAVRMRDGNNTVQTRFITANPSTIYDLVTIGSLQDSTDVVHRTGEETIDGVKIFTSLMKGRFNRDVYTRGSNYTLLYKRTASRQQWWFGFGGHTMIIANVQSDSKINTRVISLTDRPYPQPIMMVCTDSKGVVTVWGKGQYSATVQWHLMSNMLYGTDYTDGMEIIGTEYSSGPTVGGTTQYDSGATYTSVVNSTDFDYVR